MTFQIIQLQSIDLSEGTADCCGKDGLRGRDHNLRFHMLNSVRMGKF